MELRVLHVIDSLSPGGAERMAVNLANGLAEKGIKTFLCATRKEGFYRDQIGVGVGYMFLGRRWVFDIGAFLKLKAFVEKNHITHLHAHSTSIFLGWAVKLFSGKKLIYHDHHGSTSRSFFRNASLMFFLKKADHVCCVNENLKNFIIRNMGVIPSKVTVLNNFPSLNPDRDATVVSLPGAEGKRFVCLAGLRPPKDHLNLIEAFGLFNKKIPGWHLLLVGSEYKDEYSAKIRKAIKDRSLEKNVHLLGARSDIAGILGHSTIGVLSSSSEGVPVALLEYGLLRLPVICTDVGICREVLGGGKYGRVVSPENPHVLAEAMVDLASADEERKSMGRELHQRIIKDYSKDGTINRLIEIYEKV